MIASVHTSLMTNDAEHHHAGEVSVLPQLQATAPVLSGSGGTLGNVWRCFQVSQQESAGSV